MATDIELWVKEEEEAWSSQDVEKILSYYTDDCVYEDLAIEKVSRGKDEVRAFCENALRAFPDFKVETKSFFYSGNQICIEGVMTATYKADIPGLPPANGKAYSVRAAHICQLREGKAFRVTDYYNLMAVMTQLGMLPAPTLP
jgi:steroid delta-isomerase-like uncharacterized protein